MFRGYANPIFILCCLSGFSVQVATADALGRTLPVMELMPDMQAEWAAQQLVYNGVPMSIRNFASGQSSEEVLGFYERNWKDLGSEEISYSRVEDFDSVGIKSRDYFYSVRARDTDQGSEGSLVVSRALDQVANAGRSTEFPIVPGSEIVSTIEALDRSTRAETIVSTNLRSVDSNEIWFQSQLTRDGWAEERLAAPLDGERRVITFQKGKQLCQITLIGNSPENPGRTLVLVHWIKGGGRS